MVSIVTIYYNRAEHVIASIQSLLDQTYSDIEIIAVDDGSTDNTLEVLHSFTDSRLKIISHPNQGFVKSIMKAVSCASHDIIAIHGSGDISLPERIEKQVKVLTDRPEIGVVGCHVANENVVNNSFMISKPVIDEKAGISKQLLHKNIFLHGEVMFRKSVYDKSGGYRDYFKFAQDYDLWLRMSLHTDFAVVPEVLYTRYTLSDGVSASSSKISMQMYFAEIARQCFDQQSNGKKDIIQSHGVYCALYRGRTKRLSLIFWRLSIISLTQKDLEGSSYFNELSVKEKWTVNNIISIMLLALLRKSKIIQNLTFHLLSRMKGHQRKSTISDADSKRTSVVFGESGELKKM
ncbi:glycosyltransferase [Paenibacillus sepulcri]|uniref:Glycosyltransferase n=1 Tax=Paenibacillus sepulcri TaxID=359917 RepID=A0ABS7BVC3_9BACL|nr:glycosyltransferase [Paenibacillus sepulcri]